MGSFSVNKHLSTSHPLGLAFRYREDTVAKMSRYEAALERALYKALHELQRLQNPLYCRRSKQTIRFRFVSTATRCIHDQCIQGASVCPCRPELDAILAARRSEMLAGEMAENEDGPLIPQLQGFDHPGRFRRDCSLGQRGPRDRSSFAIFGSIGARD